MGASALTVVVDSREQLPLDFSAYSPTLSSTVDGVPVGDYWCRWHDGSEMPICFERKSIPDLFGTLTKGIERFKKELERCNFHGMKMVLVIEGTMEDVLAGIPQSQVKGESILKTVFTLWVKYDLIPIFCPTRKNMQRFIVETFSAVARNFSPRKITTETTKDIPHERTQTDSRGQDAVDNNAG